MTPGLVHIQHILSHIETIRFVYFTERDVVRHSLVQEIINAYDHYETASGKTKSPARRPVRTAKMVRIRKKALP